MTAAWSLAILMDQLARHVGGRSKYRRLFANSLLNRSVILVLRLLMAAPYRACIRSAHVLMAAPYRACIPSAAGNSIVSNQQNGQSPVPSLKRATIYLCHPSSVGSVRRGINSFTASIYDRRRCLASGSWAVIDCPYSEIHLDIKFDRNRRAFQLTGLETPLRHGEDGVAIQFGIQATQNSGDAQAAVGLNDTLDHNGSLR